MEQKKMEQKVKQGLMCKQTRTQAVAPKMAVKQMTAREVMLTREVNK